VVVPYWLIPIRYRIEPRPLDHLKTNGSDQIWGDPHLGFQGGSPEMARWWCCSQVVDGDDDSKVPGDGEEADGVRQRMASLVRFPEGDGRGGYGLFTEGF
jgi:hypothetical protein